MASGYRQRVVRYRADENAPIDVDFEEAGTPAPATPRRANTQRVEGTPVARKPSRRPWLVAGGVVAGVAALVGGAVYLGSRASSNESGDGGETPKPGKTPKPEEPRPGRKPESQAGWWDRVPGRPEASAVVGFDLETNWGSTPASLRPLFALMERVSKIEGSARIFAIIAKREAGFEATAHNDSAWEVDASRRAWKNARDQNPPLKYGEAAAEFGSGGLFGALAPYFLWSAVREMKGKAPLLNAPPEVMFIPRIAAFGAVAYMVGILTYYKIEDHADIKVGWASPSLLKSGRGGDTYKDIRTRFFADAAELGIDLEDETTIPSSLSAKAWPGVPVVFEALTGLALSETEEG